MSVPPDQPSDNDASVPTNEIAATTGVGDIESRRSQRKPNPLGLVAMVASILGVVLSCTVLLSPEWVMAPVGLVLVIAGWVLLPVGLILAIVAIVLPGRSKWASGTAIVISVGGAVVAIYALSIAMFNFISQVNMALIY